MRIDLTHAGVLGTLVKGYNYFAKSVTTKETGYPQITPTKVLKELTAWMLVQFSRGHQVSFPMLGTFYTKNESRKLPDYAAGRGKTRVVETWVVRFRPSSGFKARLNNMMNRSG